MFLRLFYVVIVCVIGVKLIGVRQNEYASFGGKIHSSPCNGNNNKLLSILNLLCNTTQNTSITTRDACYGCFFRTGVLPAGSTQLLSLSQCATIYLNNTIYSACSQRLAAVATGIAPTTGPLYGYCYTGYCDFVRCVRRINSNQLIDTCFLQNIVGRNLTLMNDRVGFITNTTSCILARTRCSQYNPITGELQTGQRYYTSKYSGRQDTLLNSLQITTTGDIRIVSFPSSVGVADYFCSSRTNLDQSSSGDFIC